MNLQKSIWKWEKILLTFSIDELFQSSTDEREFQTTIRESAIREKTKHFKSYGWSNVCLTLTRLKATISFSVPFNFLKWNCHLQSSICEVFWCYELKNIKRINGVRETKCKTSIKRIFNSNSVLFTTNKLVIDVVKWFDEMRLSKRSKRRKKAKEEIHSYNNAKRESNKCEKW